MPDNDSKHAEVYSSDAPGGPYDKSSLEPDTGHQVQIDTENQRHVSRDWTGGKPNDWHPTDDTKGKDDQENRHKPWW